MNHYRCSHPNLHKYLLMANHHHDLHLELLGNEVFHPIRAAADAVFRPKKVALGLRSRVVGQVFTVIWKRSTATPSTDIAAVMEVQAL